MGSIRGRSFDNSIIIVNEAQNLTEEHIKLLIGRIGEGSRLFFDGDQAQTDKALFKEKNGLILVSKLSDSPEYSKIFSSVKLAKTERSFAAGAADYLDEIG
jgi:predicted ribonuclease YlaK